MEVDFYRHGLGYKNICDFVFLWEVPENSEIIIINIYDSLRISGTAFRNFSDRRVRFNFVNVHSTEKFISLDYRFPTSSATVTDVETGESRILADFGELNNIVGILSNFEVTPSAMGAISAEYKYQLLFEMYICRWFEYDSNLAEKLEKYVVRNFPKLIREAIVRDNSGVIEKIAEKTGLFTKRNIKKYIDFAESFGSEEIYFLLREMNF